MRAVLLFQELVGRDVPCRRCKLHFRVALPDDWYASEKLARLLVENRVAFIEKIKRATGCSLADAKATMQHFAIKTGTCHWCAESLGSNDLVVECPRCTSLNVRFPVGSSWVV